MVCQLSPLKIIILICLSSTVIFVIYDNRYADMDIPTTKPFQMLPNDMNRMTDAKQHNFTETDPYHERTSDDFTKTKLSIKQTSKSETTTRKGSVEYSKKGTELVNARRKQSRNFINEPNLTKGGVEKLLDLIQHTLLSTEKEWLPQMKYQNIEHTTSGFERAKLVHERCRLYRQHVNNNQFALRTSRIYEPHSFIVNKNIKLTVCANCKVASTATKRFLTNFDKNRKNINQIKARGYVELLYEAEDQAISHGYMNVTFVREPLERLLSAYRDNKGPLLNVNPRNENVTFNVFIRDILNSSVYRVNRHMFPYVFRCHPCYVNYNFVGLQNHFDDEIAAILKRQKIPYKRAAIPDRDADYKQHSEDVLYNYYKDIPNELIHKLWEMYYLDYFLFGFPYPKHLLNKH